MAGRPQVKEGIGEKSQFKDLKLELKSHQGAEFDADSNVFKIVLKCDNDLRSIFNLFHYDAECKEEELKTGVLIQMKDNKIIYRVAVPHTGWYKLNIFATPTSNKTNSLPCVYTYLFNVKKVDKKAIPYPKQFADWKKGYELHRPRFIDADGALGKVKFEVTVTDARKVAVKVGDEWTHLEKRGGRWEGDVNLSHYQQATKGGSGMPTVSLNACTGSDDSSYATLMQYIF